MINLFIRSSTIRLGIFISTLIIAIIVVFQLVWLKAIYHSKQEEFNRGVIKSVRALYQDIKADNYTYSTLNELIESPESHLYIAKINFPVNSDSVSQYLQYELEEFDIFTDCHIGIYDSKAGKYIYTEVLKSAGTKEKEKDTAIIPDNDHHDDHLALYFPRRSRYILAEMNFWIISSAVLLIVLLLFGWGLYYFYRQKFLNETQKDFIHNFTHEFKTPVAVISLAADVLKNPAIIEKPQKLDTYAGIVKYQSTYLQTQIEKLLRFAHTESRQLHLNKEKVDIHDLVNEAVSNLTPLINERNSQLTLRLEATNPFLIADRDYLIIVITNLIDNAIKYSKNPNIVIRTESKEHMIILSVADNGIGIEKRQLKKIFEKFFRVRNDETYNAKGFGLGLSFVKKIVDAHAGKIKIESVPEKGSDFTIELPV
ncbi:MAG: HAMP domain-containing sensor histidine kinase [Chitinophagaceae bacterium]